MKPLPLKEKIQLKKSASRVRNESAPETLTIRRLNRPKTTATIVIGRIVVIILLKSLSAPEESRITLCLMKTLWRQR